jgi:hypothetical protein
MPQHEQRVVDEAGSWTATRPVAGILYWKLDLPDDPSIR